MLSAEKQEIELSSLLQLESVQWLVNFVKLTFSQWNQRTSACHKVIRLFTISFRPCTWKENETNAGTSNMADGNVEPFQKNHVIRSFTRCRSCRRKHFHRNRTSPIAITYFIKTWSIKSRLSKSPAVSLISWQSPNKCLWLVGFQIHAQVTDVGSVHVIPELQTNCLIWFYPPA